MHTPHKKTEKVMYILTVSHLPHESALFPDNTYYSACLTFLFTYYRYLIFKKVFENNVGLTESCKDAAESSHTALIFSFS